MTTKYDILDAKKAYLDHIAEHHCRIDHDQCATRVRLWKAYCGGQFSAAHKWGLEYDDHDRQEKQYRERVKSAL